MIVFGEAWMYSVQGRKAEELLKFLHEMFEFTHLKEGEDISAVRKLIIEKVDELNKKYPKTVKYSLYDYHNCLRISCGGSPMKGLAIPVYTVRPFEKGGKK